MATMRWQNVAVPIAQGVDTKTDSKALPPTKLANLENGVFTKGGTIIKRNGYTKLSDRILTTPETGTVRSPTKIGSARGIHANGEELIMLDGNDLFSYTPTEDRWVHRGRFKSPNITTETIADRDSKQVLGDCATVGDITAYAWEEDDSGVYVTIINDSTGTVYLGPEKYGTWTRPRVVAVGQHIHIYAYAGGTLYRVLLNPYGVEGGLTTSTVVTDLDGSLCLYDLEVADDYVYIAYHTSHGSNKIKVVQQDEFGVTFNSQDYAEANDLKCIAITKDPQTGTLCIPYHNATTGMRALLVDPQLQQTSNLQIDGTGDAIPASTGIPHVTAKFKDGSQESDVAYALKLDRSSSQYAQFKLDDRFSVFDIAGDMTVEFWVSFQALPTATNYASIVTRDDETAGNHGWFLQYYGGDGGSTPAGLQFQYVTAAGDQLASSGAWAPTLNTWYHVAVTRFASLGRVQFFIDGVSLTLVTGLSTAAQEDNGSTLRVGRRSDTNPLHGDLTISELRIWNDARVIGEVDANKGTELAAPYDANLVGYWRFNNDYVDQISGNNLTPSGSPVFLSKAEADGPNITYLETEQTNDNFPCLVFYECRSAAVSTAFVKKATITTRGTVTAGALWKRHCGLASHAWIDGEDVHVNVLHQTTLQTMYFTYMDDATLIAKMLSGFARDLDAGDVHGLPGVQDLGNGVYQWLGGFKKRLDTNALAVGASTATANPVFVTPGLKRFRMDYQSNDTHDMVSIGRTSYFNGGMLWQFDGHRVVEVGFHVFPEGYSATAISGSGLPAGDYWYKVYAVYTNANGQVERSAQAAPVKLTTSGGNLKGSVTIPTLAHTRKMSSSGIGAEIHFEVYRTTINPSSSTPFFKVSSDDPTATGDNGYVWNTQATDTVSFLDVMTDTDLVKQEVDYAFSGELDNTAPPAPSVIAEGKDRVWLAGFEDTSEIQYSKLRYAGKALTFNDGLKITIPGEGGAIVGLRVLNNNLIVFKRRAIYIVPGDGPGNTGVGRFGAAQIITGDVGCKSARSIVDSPIGLLFQSDKGIYILTKQYGVKYIGAPVEAYNAQTITDAVLSTTRSHIVFMTSAGRALLYDYLFGQWSTFTNHEGNAACMWQDTLCYARNDGRVYRETTTDFTDAGAPVKLRIETAWIKLRQLQGFMRVRRALVLGEFRSRHRLAMDVAYDYEELRRRLVFDATGNVAQTTFGDPTSDGDAGTEEDFGYGDPFGSGTTSSGMESAVYQFRAHLPVQKCQAVKFYFEDIASIGEALAESYEITELMLEVGTKRGTFKVADSRSL
tara:strand:- start:2170 stop:6033 length:3864 start_codon:yes stop_codon:yes gene_type:complete